MQLIRVLSVGTALAVATLSLSGCTTEPAETTDNSPPAAAPEVAVASDAVDSTSETETQSQTQVTTTDPSNPPVLELPMPGSPAGPHGPGILPDYPPASEAALASWMTNWEQAKAKAQAEQKELLILFTGSDWCPGCIMLERQVFQFQPFYDYADEHLLLVKFDFPRTEGAMSKEQLDYNRSIQIEFGEVAQGLPSVLLADTGGRAYAHTSYRPGGPAAYATHLTDLREIREERDAAFAAAAELEGIEKAKKLEEGLLTLEPQLFFPSYDAEVLEIIGLDADNAAGLKEKYSERRDSHRFLSRLSGIIASANANGLKETVDEVLQSLDQLAADFPSRQESQNIVAVNRMMVLSAVDRDEEAVTIAEGLLKRDDLEPGLRNEVVEAAFGSLRYTKQHEKCIAVADAEIARTADSFRLTNLLVMKGRCQIDLGQFEASKQTFEEAREAGGPQFWQQIDSIEARLLEEARNARLEVKPETQPTETTSPETKPTEGTPPETKPAEAAPSGTKPTEAAPAESKPAETEPKPAEAEAKPSEPEERPAEVESKPAAAETTKPSEETAKPVEPETTPAEAETKPTAEKEGGDTTPQN